MGQTAVAKAENREKFLQGFARAGLGAHGVVYCLMSALSILAALGYQKDSANKSDAFKMIYDQPFGKVLLAIVALAMLGYVTLRFFQAFKDTRHEGKDTVGIGKRIGFAFSGLVYLALSATAFNLAFLDPGGNGGGRQFMVKKALELPLGVWIVGIGGVCLIGAGFYQMYRGFSKSFMKHVDLRYSDFKKTFERIGIVGHIARGIVFSILGYLIVRAAIHANPKEAESTDGAFEFVKSNFGDIVMAVVALGLLAYGLFMIVRAIHEKMKFR